MTREEREQALEWFKNRPITMSGAKKMYDLAISALEQPEPCEDTVSRKAVEEMLKNGFPARGMWEIEGDVVKQTVCETLADALMELESLPSVQPEIIRCKNCAKREYCRTSTVWAVPPSDDWFCGDAEPYKGEQE